MLLKKPTRWILLLSLLAGLLFPAAQGLASPALGPSAQSGVTAFDLILAMNTLRVSNGLPALIEDPIVMAVAQSTAEIMAASEMSWHIGDVRGRLAAAGYGGGATVWGTENFAVGNHSIDEIMVVWSDASHMIPAVNPAYCHVGAGVATSPSGRTYYVLQAAYTSSKSCGEYKPPAGGNNDQSGNSDAGERPPVVSQVIIPVKVAKPDAEGKIFHVVQPGQSFWAIAIAYGVTIKDIETWNNISQASKLQVGQKLFIPGDNTEGYATPTPVGMIQLSTPDADGRIIHTVQSYQTLITIAEAYQTEVTTILALNGLQEDWPLQIDQELLIDPGHVTPSPTPRPLTAIEKLTPESDGQYYHTIQSGETLSGIAGLYEIPMADLMAWNGLTASSIIMAGQKLVLQVTPPPTETVTPGPPTRTPAFTRTPSPTSTLRPTRTTTPPPAVVQRQSILGGDKMVVVWVVSLGLAVGLFVFGLISRKKP